MKFASRKQLNQQKKAEKEFNPAMPAHLSKKQMRPPAPSKRPGSGMALAGNLAASIAEEAEEPHLHASCGFGAAHPKTGREGFGCPAPRWVATSRIAGENRGHGNGLCANDLF